MPHAGADATVLRVASLQLQTPMPHAGADATVEYGEKELNLGTARIYQLVDAAEISIQLGYTQDCAIAQSPPPEGQLRPLKAVPEDERKAIWEEATRKAIEEGAKLTAKRVPFGAAESC